MDNFSENGYTHPHSENTGDNKMWLKQVADTKTNMSQQKLKFVTKYWY